MDGAAYLLISPWLRLKSHQLVDLTEPMKLGINMWSPEDKS